MTKKQKKMLCRIIVTAVLVLAIRLFSIGGLPGTLLYLAAYLIIGYDILHKAGKGILRGQVFDENFLMAVATVGAIGLAFYEKSGDFMEAVAVMLFYQIGELFQSYAVGKSRRNITALMDIRPDYANIEQDGQLTQVDPDDVPVGAVIVVQPGEKVPLDGVVLEGSSAVNESALTGESIPVDKAPGDGVSAATVNQSGYLRCRATRVGQDTTLSQIIRMVSDAAATKAPIAKIADKVSGVFVPAVISIAAVTTAVWLLLGHPVGYALARGISVLVISCPCALGLATPVAIMVGSGLGAKNGILFKTAASLEETGRVQIVALDKTGTITSGQPRVTDILPAEGVTEQELLTYALALEQKSEHPLARAVLDRAAGLTAPEVSDFQALPGNA